MPNCVLLIKYFDTYQAFCFDLSSDSVLKGDLNFKLRSKYIIVIWLFLKEKHLNPKEIKEDLIIGLILNKYY